MKKKVTMLIGLIIVVSIFISIVFLKNRVTAPSVNDIISEKNYTIENQEKCNITLTIQKTKLDKSNYLSNGKSFSKREIIVYQSDTTTIYLEKIMKSNEDDSKLYFIFNFDYDLSSSGTILVPYQKNEDATYNFELDLLSHDLMDTSTSYTDAVQLRGNGPKERFSLYVNADICKKANETMKIEVSCNKLMYTKIK